uniref:Uncharacterized protein n=1 Tax=Anguilla anguilla TaxID=7936 RepID=A0A0E9UXM4_ANGAN
MICIANTEHTILHIFSWMKTDRIILNRSNKSVEHLCFVIPFSKMNSFLFYICSRAKYT